MNSQKEMFNKYCPIIVQHGKVYEKFSEIEARIAFVCEKIITTTSDGKETERVAEIGDYVVRNLTKAREQYIRTAARFEKSYRKIDNKDTEFPWSRYQAIGSVQAIQYRGDTMKFVATWGEEMIVRDGDMLAIPLPKKKEIYRIAAKEFAETYRERQ